MSRKKLRRSLGKETDIRIGELDIMELRPPKGYAFIEIYADTETYYKTHKIEPWKHVGEPGFTDLLKQLEVYPCIISWQYRRRNFKKGNTDTYESGGWVRKTVFIETLDDFEQFVIDLAFIYNDWRLTPVIYFHNSAYDIPVLTDLFHALDPDCRIDYFAKPKNRSFIRGWIQSPLYNFYCEFGDTLQYTKISIDEAGKIFGKEKIKGVPYGLCNLRITKDGMLKFEDIHTGETKQYPKDKYMEYAERDVEIMRLLHERNRNIINSVNSIVIEDWDKMDQKEFNRKCKSSSSHSKRVCNIFLKRNGWEDIDTVFRWNMKSEYKSEDDLTRIYQQNIESNCGGFTSSNKNVFYVKCKEDEEIKYFDRNSMYPTIMTGELPYGILLTEKPNFPHITWYCIRLKTTHWTGNMSCLKTEPFGKTKMEHPLVRKIKPGKEFFVLKDYIDFVEANAHIEYELMGTYYQRTTKVLKPLMEKYYTRRKEIKAVLKDMAKHGEKHTPRYTDLDYQQEGLKLLMNALYGKMCENGHLRSCIFHDGEYIKYDSNTEYYPCILTGSYITYKARLSLLNKIKAVVDAGYTFLYADTDSVTFLCPKGSDLTPVFGVDKGNLGEWKLEGTFDVFMQNGMKKKYLMANTKEKKIKYALSGIPKRVQNIITYDLANSDERQDMFETLMENMKIFFDKDENIVIKSCKPTTTLSRFGSKQIIFNTDYAVNGDFKKVTGYIYLDGDDYKLEKCQ